MLDLDHLREVNTNHGHLVGDRAIGLVAGVLARSVRTTDLVARFGGEEFVVLLPSATEADARAVCDRIRASLAEASVPTDHGPMPVTVSGGGVSVRADESLDHALGRADTLLYQAKDAGRARIVMGWDLAA